MSLLKFGNVPRQLFSLKNGTSFYLATRNAGGHTKGTKYVSPTFWRPGPVPRTPEEHKAAAEKYNLEPEDYRPHPNFNCDYPDMPVVALGNRDPFYPWDNYHIRRNHGEPMHIHFDLHQEEKGDWLNDPPIMKYSTAFWSLMATLGGLSLLVYLGDFVPTFKCAAEKQYPNVGETHYAFDLKKAPVTEEFEKYMKSKH